MAKHLEALFASGDDDDDTASRLKARRARRKDNSLNAARRQLEAMRDALQGAHQEILRLLAEQMNEDDDKSTSASRRAALDRLDAIVRKVAPAGVVRAQSSAPCAIGGGAHSVSFARERELRRLGLLQ